MRALLVEHSRAEGAGLLGGWLADAGLPLETVRPAHGEPLPPVVSPEGSGHVALVVLGGPQAAYDDDLPFLADELAMLRATVAAGTPLLGICLGGQLLARACGGSVRRGSAGPEIGATLVAKRDAAGRDPLIASVPFTPDVVQWHWDEISSLPPGAALLASSSTYPNQAFRVGERAWGLQFHVEVDPAMASVWAAGDADRLRSLGLEPDAVVAGVEAIQDDLGFAWQPVAERFAELARG